MKHLKILVVLFIVTILSLGFQAISYRSNVFNDEAVWCCDNGLCENTDPEISCRCSSQSSMFVKYSCLEISRTCKDCVDKTVRNCICNGGGSDFCMKDDGTFYYGNPEVEHACGE
jgi:hypothetical protein